MAWPNLGALGATLAIVLGAMVVLWGVSLARRDASIADIFWGPGFALVGWTSAGMTGSWSPRALLVNVLVSIWALRLALHISARHDGEDRRYRAMRRRHGDRFPFVSLGTVFLLQGVLLWIVSWPLQAIHQSAPSTFGPADVAGASLFVAGFLIETIADLQLTRFTRNPDNQMHVMDEGLWRYSRHPNYFGDCLAWWGIGLIAVAQGAWWALAGPALMTVLLIKVSGVGLLESTITARRPGYRDYIARTSAFVPWPPRRGTR